MSPTDFPSENFRRCTDAKLLDEAEGLLVRALDSNPKNADVMDAMATFLSQEWSSLRPHALVA